MEKKKQVQISEELFNDFLMLVFCEYNEEVQARCEKGLKEKLDKIVLRDIYSKSKDTTLTDEEREKARQEYLDRKGIHGNFRY